MISNEETFYQLILKSSHVYKEYKSIIQYQKTIHRVIISVD